MKDIGKRHPGGFQVPHEHEQQTFISGLLLHQQFLDVGTSIRVLDCRHFVETDFVNVNGIQKHQQRK